MEKYDCIIIGSGMGSLTAAALLVQMGKKVLIIEQNYLPGGCTSSYWRKGFVFEAGATTLVGLDEGQPLHYLLKKLNIQLETIHLPIPMKVSLKNGKCVTKYEKLEEWIIEAENCFGKQGQRAFWEECYAISQFVWKTSLKQTHFPISKFSDILHCIKNVDLQQIRHIKYAFQPVKKLLEKHNLHQNPDFVAYVNAQLLITAQNNMDEVNTLFGATALCYTNYSNHYVKGGLINLVNPFIQFIENNKGEIRLRESVKNIESKNRKYIVRTSKSVYEGEYVISGIPINNTLKIFPQIAPKFQSKIMQSHQLNSAFQMGIGFMKTKSFPCIHFQIHLSKNLSYIDASSIFVSLSHENDPTRADNKQHMVASVSTHWQDPAKQIEFDKTLIENEIVEALENASILSKADIIYSHSSTPESWQKWTQREFGFVGGYPQYINLKPWQLIDSRLDKYKAYAVGDSVYPGQGIPGVVLGGIIAVEKLKTDWL